MGTVSVLALLDSRVDKQCLKNIFSHTNWKLQFASSMPEAQTLLRQDTWGVIISDCQLSDGKYWTHALHTAQKLSVPPLLIVADRSPDTLAEVLNLGGYDVLVKPFDFAEVIRIVGAAWLAWKRKTEAAYSPVSSFVAH